MSLAKLFEADFRGDIRHRGEAYFRAGRVSITRVTADEIFASVQDGIDHHTQLSLRDGDVTLFCSSVAESGKAPTTKYVWATLLAVDQAGYVPQGTRRGAVPPFVAPSNTRRRVSDLMGEDDEFDDFTLGGGSSSATGVATLTSRKPVPAWAQTLIDLRDDLNHAAGTSAAQDREFEILYEIDVARSRDHQALVIQTSQRQRRTSGQWGRLKPFRMRPREFDRLTSSEDRRILAYLFGGVPDREGIAAGQVDRAASCFRYILPSGLTDLVLPQMCASGRVRLTDDSESRWDPVAWDPQEDAWELTVCIEDDEADAWETRGELRRGDESLALTEPLLILPGGLVLWNRVLSRLDDFGAFPWVQLLHTGTGLSVPHAEGVSLIERLCDLPALPRLELPDALRLEEVHTVPKPALSLDMPTGSSPWRSGRVRGRLEFIYDQHRVRGNRTRWAIVDRETRKSWIRDRQAEQSFWNRLQDLGVRRLSDIRFENSDVEISAGDLAKVATALIQEGWEVTAVGARIREPGQPMFRVESGIDWFDVTGEVDFEGTAVNFPELLSALVRGDRMIRLSDGSLGLLPEEWLARYGALAGLGEVSEDGVRFRKQQAALLDALLAAQEDVTFDEGFLGWRDQLQNFTGIAPGQEPPGFKGDLRGYQREGLGWLEFLERLGCGGCLADDMGLGKTIQVLALLSGRKLARGASKPSLVIVPKSLLFNWTQEAHRFTPDLKTLEYTGLDRTDHLQSFREHDIILTTYGTMRRDVVTLRENEFDYVILDEAQTIKNAASQVAKATRLLKCEHRLALSGTPIENHLGDLWSIFEFLNPGLLGRSSVFKSLTANLEDTEARQIVARAVRPFVLRRTKREVAKDLPEKMEETIFCRMPPKQQELYDELKAHYRQSLLGIVDEQGIGKAKFHVLEALLRLRQAACHPGLLNPENVDERFAKLDVLIPSLQELIDEGHKALVFSQFTSMLDIAKRHLDQAGVPYVYLDGKTRRRKEVITQFQEDPNIPLFLISLKAGGLGLNLTAADYVFLLDPWWNPAVEAQAIDRAHRVGQDKKVFAYRMICKDTVEERIAELQGKKRSLADAILEADTNLMRDLTIEDLEVLLS